VSATLLAIDAGTTGVSAILFDHELRSLCRAYREFEQRFPRPGWVEHEAGAILQAVDQVLREVLGHVRAADAVALGLTNQRETVFALERASGRALAPGIVWQDRRTEARCRELVQAGHEPFVHARTGLVLDPYFSATKIEWLLANEPDLARRARAGQVVFGTVDTLIVAHLTGGVELVTDPTNASRTLLFDIAGRRWDGELCGLFGLEPGWLPEVRSSSAEFGRTLPQRTGGRSLPIRGIAGDQQAALFGQGCFDPGTLKATYGTGSFLLLNTGDERRDSQGGLLTTLAVGRSGASVFALEGSVFVCGALVQWLRDQLGFFQRSSEIEALARSVPDSAGVFVVPAFAGLGAPYWDPGARGALLGLTRGTSRAHIARAALEALAFQNAELIELLRLESGLPIGSLLADGGASANDLLLELQADLAGLVVLRPADVAATARGAAALAGLGVGLWPDPGQPAALRDGLARFSPALGAGERAGRLAAWRAAVQRVRSRVC
jgi:glycerol kinase